MSLDPLARIVLFCGSKAGMTRKYSRRILLKRMKQTCMFELQMVQIKNKQIKNTNGKFFLLPEFFRASSQMKSATWGV